MPDHDELLKRITDINSGITFGTARKEDASQFITLYNRQYLRQKTVDYFFWQFFEAPLPCSLFVAREGETIAGCYGVQILPLSDGRKCAFTVDLLIGEPYRNRGLFYLLEVEAMKYARDNSAAVSVSLPNTAGMKAHAAIPGWLVLGQVGTMSLAHPPKHGDLPLAGCGSVRHIAISKSLEYRSWRYDRNPTGSYDYVHLPSGDFAVTKIFVDPSNGMRFGDIVDYECQGQDESKLASLFRKAAQHLLEKNVSVVTTWSLRHTRLFTILDALGFNEKEAERYLCVKPTDSSGEDLAQIDRWSLVQADSEVY